MAPAPSSSPADTQKWSFDADETGKPPAGFEVLVGPGSARTWEVQGWQAPPSHPNVVGLGADVHDSRPSALVVTTPRADVRAAVLCRMESPRADGHDTANPQAACGLVARVQDANDYYLAAVNAHDEEIGLYAVKSGLRTKLGAAKTGAIAAEWIELELSVKGDALSVAWARSREIQIGLKPVVEAHDRTFTAPGGVGMWTFVNSSSAFDDFSVTTL